MSYLKALFKKLKSVIPVLQVTAISLAFAFMVAVSYIFTSSFERRHLVSDATDVLAFTQAHLEMEMRQTKTLLSGLSLSIRSMLIAKYSPEKMDRYLTMISDSLLENGVPGYFSLYAYLEGYGFINVGGREFDADYSAPDSLWYRAAIEANGQAVTGEPFFCKAGSGDDYLITLSRSITGSDGKLAGVIAIDLRFDRFTQHLKDLKYSRGGYAVMFDANMILIHHPNKAFIGKRIGHTNSAMYGLKEELLRTGKIYERTVPSFKGDKVVVFVKSINNGWYIGVLTPKNSYFHNTRIMAAFLTILGAVMAAVLSGILLRVTRTRRLADEFAQVMFSAMPFASLLWNKKRECLMCNDEAVRLYGVKGRESFRDFTRFSPKTQPCGGSSPKLAEGHFEKAFETGYNRFEWMHQSADGEPRPAEVTLVRVTYNGKPTAISFVRDRREEIAAFEKLREADERTQLMLDAAPVGITLWDRNFNLVDFNYEAARVVGIYSKREYRERFAETAPEYQADGRKSTEKLVEFISKAFEEGQYRTDWNHNTIDGETIPFDATAVRLKYKDGDVVMVCCRDLREVNAATAKMREADERAQILLHSTPMSCTLFDENSMPIDCNSAAFRLLGLDDKQEYLDNYLKYSMGMQEGVPMKQKSAENTRLALCNGFHRFEWTHKDINGNAIPCEITLTRVKYQGKDVLAGYSRDLRELREMIRNMQRAEDAERSSKAKSKFLAAMSHEIRTPMNVILGVTEIQLQDETLPPHMREALVQIYNSSDLLLTIINDILDLSKIEADKMEFSPSRYELASLISDTASINIMRSSKPTEFELDVDENAPARLYGDELRIKQILNNLLSNAFKFTEEGSVKLSAAVEERAGGADGDNDVTLVLVVSDSGQGMSKEQVDKLFTEYARFNLETNRAIDGTGLGMNITRRLVDLMGGSIKVESEINKGTTVTVRLPQKRIGRERIGRDVAKNLQKFRMRTSADSRRSQLNREYMPYGRVLVVDDVESNLYVAKGLLAPYGLQIDTASSGQEAIDKVKAGSVYDIIFMDHMMPKMDGMEAAKRIRDFLGYPHPIVALTANAVVGQADVFISNGFEDFISKPIDIRQLNAVLNRLVRDKQPPEIIERANSDRDSTILMIEAARRNAPSPELMAIFARDAHKALPILGDTADNIAKLPRDELNRFTICVHGIKSSLLNIGEKRLAEVALALEKSGKANNRNAITELLPGFITALRRVTEKAEAESSKVNRTADADENPKFLREQLALIAKACKKLDERAIDEALEKLKKMTWTEKTKNTLDKIAELVLHSNFDEAAGVAAE